MDKMVSIVDSVEQELERNGNQFLEPGDPLQPEQQIQDSNSLNPQQEEDAAIGDGIESERTPEHNDSGKQNGNEPVDDVIA